jgi:20S proteasome subunit beta 5
VNAVDCRKKVQFVLSCNIFMCPSHREKKETYETTSPNITMSFLATCEDIYSSNFSLDDCPRLGPFTWINNADDDDDDSQLSRASVRRQAAATIAPKNYIKVAGVNVTADPLDSSLRPTSSSWQLAKGCPVPRSVPKLNLKKGTTTLGFRFQGGVILAVDSRASSGQYVASQTVQKVLEINDFLLGTMAGGAADCQYWERVLGMECRLWQLRNNSRITVSAASKILANITYAYRNHGLSMGTMIAGWDKFGPALYYVDDQGTRVKHELFSVGSGSIYAYGVLDTGYNFDLTVDAACELARRSIFHATYRDGGSGGYVSVYHIHANGWTKVSRDDQTQLYPRYMPGK